MSLTTRLSVFFLTALAFVLVGFSATVYGLVYLYLEEENEEHLTGALDTLEAAIDREPGGLDWEPEERHVAVGRDMDPQAVRWEVLGANGARLDRSANLTLEKSDFQLIENSPDADLGFKAIQHHGEPWQIAWRRIRAMSGPSPGSPASDKTRHQQLVLVVGVPVTTTQTTLRWLAIALLGTSGGIWLVAAITGRWMSRRALAPLTRMAGAARAMDANERDQRLPDPGTADELVELHGAFNGLLDRLQDSFERQRRFTGDASHQLRTPLTAMLGHVEVALRRERPAEEYRDVLTLLRNQTDHLRRIVEALLFLARADGDADLARLESVDLASWAAEHLKAWQTHARVKDIHFECKGSATVRVQLLLLGQLLDNLLDNACKYSEPGTPITITVANADDSVTLSVQDAGSGISPDDLPHVFEPFYRSAEARRLGKVGVGLGLAMAQRIAAAFGGLVLVQSEVGKGSRFTVRLPAADAKTN